MEAYANALLIAIPLFLLLILIEMGVGYWKNNNTYTVLDTVSSISSGMTNILKDTLGLGLVLVSYPSLLSFFGTEVIKSEWWVWFLAFVFVDFAGYWNHRLSHKINIFWNQHMIHHSSESFNLSCALRQSISNIIGYFPVLLLPAALLGIPYEIIAILAPIQLFAQFWYHTQHIGKLGVLEYVIVTPSQHRVHHAINARYIDKNLGQVFSIWDRMFGTFQEELDFDPPQYGVLKQVATWNPFTINFMHFWQILQDAWHTRSWLDKGRIWFMPTGWRPADVSASYPIVGIADVFNFKRYEVKGSIFFNSYAVFQLLGVALILMLSLAAVGDVSPFILGLLAAYIGLSIFSYSLFMDQWKWAVYPEFLRLFTGAGLLIWAWQTRLIPIYFSQWLGVLFFYLIFSLFLASYVTFIEPKVLFIKKQLA
jgi:sterol desaturase/sphingolipid hydroxylase (fatty acid hydroxylase superfamily)